MFKRFYGCLLLLLLAGQAFADDTNSLDFFKEDPKALYSVDLGDASVDFLLSGYWKSTISFGTSKGLSNFLPGYISEPWKNSVDLLLSVIYDQRFLVEAHVTDKIEESTFVLGYEQEGSYGLKKLLVGNDRIGIDLDYGSLPFAKSIRGNPGLAFRWTEESFDLEALIRVQTSNTITENYRGGSTIDGYNRTVRDFALGYSFNLPHKNIDNLKVYVESSEGFSGSGGRKFKLLAASDFSSFNLTEGEFALKTEQRGLIAVSYTVGGSLWNTQTGSKKFPYLNASTGILDFSSSSTFDLGGGNFYANVSDPYKNFFKRSDANGLSGISLSIGGTSCLIVHRDNEINPFENLSYYKSSTKEQKTIEFSVSTNEGIVLKQSSLSVDGYFKVLNQASSPFSNQYPLASLTTINGTDIYSPVEPVSSLPLLNTSEQGKSIKKIPLGGQPIPETIEVRRNNIIESNWIYDFDSNAIQLTIPTQTTDELTISYEKQDRLGENRYFQFLAGISNKIDKYSDFSNALFGTLSLNQNADINELSSSDLSISDQTRLHLADEVQKLNLQVLLGLQIPTIDSFNRVSTFSESEYSVEINASNLVPPPPGPIPYNLANERGALLYQDFETLNGFLAYSSASAPSPSAYANGNPIGPNIASATSSDPDLGQVAVLNFNSSASENWIGAAININDSEKNLLKTASYIRFWIRGISLPAGTYNISLVGGSFSEDTDGNSSLSIGKIGSGIPFSHRSLNLFYQKDAGERVVIQGEDTNQNKYLDLQGGLYDIGLSPSLSPGSSINSYVIPLNDQLRTLLSGGNKIAIYISVPSSSSGTIIWGGLRIGTKGLIAKDSTDLALESSIVGTSPAVTGKGSLSFEEGQALNSLSTNSFTKIVLSNSNPNTITKLVRRFTFYQADKIKLFLGSDASLSGIALKAYDEDKQRAISLSGLNLTAGAWYKLEIDAPTKTFKLTNIAGGLVQSGNANIDYTKSISTIELTIPAATANLYIDDLISSNSMVNARVKTLASYTLAPKELDLNLDGFSMLKDPSLQITANYDSSIPSKEYLQANYDFDLSNDLKFTLLESDVHLGLGLTRNNDLDSFKYSHSISIPSPSVSVVSLTDTYSYQKAMQNNSSHGISLSLNGKGSLIKVSGETQINFVNLDQAYGLVMKTPEAVFGNFGYTFQIKNDIENKYQALELDEAYGLNWYQLFSHFDPLSQSEDMGFDYAYHDKGFSVTSQLKLGYRYFLSSSLDDSNYFSYSLASAIPIESLFLRLNYQSSFNRSFVRDSSIDVQEQNLELFNRVFSSEFLSPPFVELYQDSQSIGIKTGLLKSEPSFAVAIENPNSLGVFDFVVPKAFGIDIKAQKTLIPISESFLTYHVISGRFQAINQFGKTGVAPLFDFYATDVFQNNLKLYFDDDLKQSTALGIDSKISLYGLNSERNWAELANNLSSVLELQEPWSISVSNKYLYNYKSVDFFSDTLALSFNWGGLSPDTIDPRPQKLQAKLGLLTNEESLSFTFSSPNLGYSPNATLPLDIAVKANQNTAVNNLIEFQHSTILAYPNFGYLRAYVKFGMMFMDIESEIEALLGLELKLNF